jgi:hypothetical protein
MHEKVAIAKIRTRHDKAHRWAGNGSKACIKAVDIKGVLGYVDSRLISRRVRRETRDEDDDACARAASWTSGGYSHVR